MKIHREPLSKSEKFTAFIGLPIVALMTGIAGSAVVAQESSQSLGPTVILHRDLHPITLQSLLKQYDVQPKDADKTMTYGLDSVELELVHDSSRLTVIAECSRTLLMVTLVKDTPNGRDVMGDTYAKSPICTDGLLTPNDDLLALNPVLHIPR